MQKQIDKSSCPDCIGYDDLDNTQREPIPGDSDSGDQEEDVLNYTLYYSDDIWSEW